MEQREFELGDLLSYEQPTQYIVESTEYNDAYKIPVLTAGKSFVLGYTNETTGIFDKLPVIIFDDFTTSSQYVNFQFKVKSSAMKILNPNLELVLPKFIFYKMQMIDFDHGTHKRYWIQQYSKIKAKIPSIPRQEIILTKIEELFSELDKGVETLITIKKQLEVYRQAVLKEAFEGSLIIGITPKNELLKSFIEKPRYGTSKKCDHENEANSTAVIRIPNIDVRRGVVSYDDVKYANFESGELETLDLREGDLLVIRSNGSVSLVGRAAYVRDFDKENTFAGYLIRLRIIDKKKLSPKFLHLYLSSFRAREYFESVAKSTSGVNNLNAQEISNLVIPYVDIERQEAIIKEIDSRLSVCDNIEQIVEAALEQAESMRKSILKQAFEGRLINE